MTEDEKNKLRQFIYAFVPGEKISDDQQLISSSIVDSIQALRLVNFLEMTFGILFDATDVNQDNLNTINDVIRFVEQKRFA